MLALLLDAGANIYATDESGMTAIHWAIQNGSEATVKLLLDRGARLDIKDKIDRTALIYAELRNQKKLVEMIKTAAATRPATRANP
jgi:uncharacterized protein